MRRYRTLPGLEVRERRNILCQLPRSALLKLYARSPGRTRAQANRSWLTDTALIDLIIWTQGRTYTATSKIGAQHMADETTTTTTTVINEPIPEPKPEPKPEPDTTKVETEPDGTTTTTVERP